MDPRQLEALEAAIRSKIAAEQAALEAKAKEDAAAKAYEKIRAELLSGSKERLLPDLEPDTKESSSDGSVIQKVSRYFEIHPGQEIRIEEIGSDLTHVPASSIRSALARLVDLNKIRKVGRGTYVSQTGVSA